jgi:hypothetical protein
LDDFSNADSGWPIDDDGDTIWRYDSGEYEMYMRNAKWWAGALAPVGASGDYSVEADMRRLSGSTSDYGLIFDFQDWENFYLLVVDPGDQWYGVAKFVAGNLIVIIPQTTNTSAIKPDQEVNHLKVDRTGNKIAVFINDKPLKSATDVGPVVDPVIGIEFGLYMESDADAPAAVKYDNFEAWRLVNGQTQTMAVRLRNPEPARTGGGSCEANADWCLSG